MNSRICTMMLAVAAIGAFAAPALADTAVCTVKAPSIRLRQSPSKKAHIVAILKKDARITTAGTCAGGWVKVTSEDGRLSGYVAGWAITDAAAKDAVSTAAPTKAEPAPAEPAPTAASPATPAEIPSNENLAIQITNLRLKVVGVERKVEKMDKEIQKIKVAIGHKKSGKKAAGHGKKGAASAKKGHNHAAKK